MHALNAARDFLQPVKPARHRPSARRAAPAQAAVRDGLIPMKARGDFSTRYGLGSFLYARRRPCSASRLRDFFASGWPGLVRAKGFFWSEEEPDRIGFLSVAGREARIDYLGPWAAAMIERELLSRAALPESLSALWQEPHGDRRQEIVLIGVGLDADALEEALDEQLVG